MADYSGGKKIVGMNTESTEINEGVIRYDIIFYVHTPNGLAKMIINIECQKGKPSKYNIVNRAIYYACRMVSSQKERDFENSNFDDINRVYTIWIMMNMNACSLNHIHLTDDLLLGDVDWEGDLDLLNIVIIGLPKELPEKSEKYELHRLLTTLLSRSVPIEKKLEILDEEYDIACQTYESEVSTMCNLSEGIYEDGIKSEREKNVLGFYKNGVSLDVIAESIGISVEEIQNIIASKTNKN